MFDKIQKKVVKANRNTNQNGVEKWMHKHASQTKYHVGKMIDQLMVGDNFQYMLFQGAMIAHQTDHMHSFQYDGTKAQQPYRWRWSNREDHTQYDASDKRTYAGRSWHSEHAGQRK